MKSTIARQKPASYPPDIEIEIAKNAWVTLEFYRAREMIELVYELGYEHARDCLSSLPSIN